MSKEGGGRGEEGGNTKTSAVTTSGSNRKKNNGYDGSTATDSSQSRPKVAVASNMEPTYYIGGGNGNALIEETLNAFGWRRIKDKTDESYRLRWCELKSSINYNTFKEGEQMVNHIPNCNLLTNKLGLLNSLQEYSRVCSTVEQQKKTMKLDFIPETYRLDDPKDRQIFNETYKENEIWICKPTGRNQGKGIFLVRSLAELNQTAAEKEENGEGGGGEQREGKEGGNRPSQKPSNRIIQRYIINPLLVNGRKFDIRCYMLIASTVPYLVLYHKGYLRLSMYEYDNNCDNIIAHLTNQFIQKKDPKYIELKEETAWSMDRFNQYVNEKLREDKGLEKDWVYNTLTTTMMQIMTHAFKAVKHKLQRKIGYFDLYGLDFMIDENMKIWLIEVNVNPCLATNCAALREVVPDVVRETLHLAIECFEKSRKGRPLRPLQSLKEFQVLFYETPSSSSKQSAGTTSGRTQTTNMAKVTQPSTDNSKSVSPIRRSRSISPSKDGGTKPGKKIEQPANPRNSSPTKVKTDSPSRETSSFRMSKGGRTATFDNTVETESKQTGPNPTIESEEKEKTSKQKSLKKKKNSSEMNDTQENSNSRTNRLTTADRNGSEKNSNNNNSNSTPTKHLTKTVVNAATSELKSAKTSTSVASSSGVLGPKSTNTNAAGQKKRAAKKETNSAIREETPNRGS